MDIKLANEIIACLPKTRTLFPYYEDRYAVMLLERFVADGMAISNIKASRYAKLLNRPAIRKLVSVRGDGRLCREDFGILYVSELEHYVLTIGKWGDPRSRGGWFQTSRRGVNLVLQLNFSRKHDRIYRRLVDPLNRRPYTTTIHPVCKRGRNTLAWARLDINLQTGEALVEEIQNDWLRDTLYELKDARAALSCRRNIRPEDVRIRYANNIRAVDVIQYVEGVLRVHFRIWADAMLAASIWFLSEEIGIDRIWYHDHETGARLKKLKWCKPPRSIYTELPKRFCFERTTDVPGFILDQAPKPFKRDVKAGKEHFWCLNL